MTNLNVMIGRVLFGDVHEKLGRHFMKVGYSKSRYINMIPSMILLVANPEQEMDLRKK